ncbi:hypothetical protein LINPERPRIM_LOCUS10297 [Linum perenne]
MRGGGAAVRLPEMHPDPPVPCAVHVGRRRQIEVHREV